MRLYGFKSHKAVVYIIPVIFLVFEELLKIGGIVNSKKNKAARSVSLRAALFFYSSV